MADPTIEVGTQGAITASGNDGLVDENIDELEPATFEVTDFSISSMELEPEVEFLVQANITNTGEETDSDLVTLSIDGETVEDSSIELDPGETATSNFTIEAPEEPGEYNLTIETADDEVTEGITVLAPPNFQILDADMPVDVDQGQNVTVDLIIENTGSHGTQPVNFTVYAQEEDDEELIDADVAVVDDSRNTTQGEAYVDVLETEFETVELLTNETVLDEMATFDVLVVYRLIDDTQTEEFLDQLDDDQGVVYLDDMFRTHDERWADGVLRLESFRGDPGHWDSVTFDADQQPPEVNITADHPILDGVGDVGETVILNDGTENLPWGSWFEDYSGEVIAEVDYAASDPEQRGGPGIGVNDAENEVLLPALNHENVLEYLTPEGEALVVNAVAHVAQDVDETVHTTDNETDEDDDFPFFGEVVIHVWDELTLDAGETTTIELEYEVPENLSPDLYTQELSTENDSVISELWVELHADIEVSSYSLDPDPAEEDLTVGDTLTAEVVLANHGDRPGEFEVEYIVDEEVVANETVEVDTNSTNTVELDHDLREAGTKTISVNGVDPVQIEVEPGPQADIEVESYSLDPDPTEETLYVGETLSAEAVVTNHGDASGEFEVEYIVDEEVVANETVGVDANSTKTVELDHDLRETGTKIVSVNGVDPVQISVESGPVADIEVTSYSLDPDPTDENLYVGETLAVEAVVTNHGDAAGEFEVEYIVDEEVVANQTVEVDADSTKTVELGHELRETGTKIVSVNGVDPVQIHVESGPVAAIEVSSYSLDPNPETNDIFVGTTLTAEAVVTNHGDASGAFEVEYIVDEEVVANETVVVAAGSTDIVELDHELRESGTKIVSVNGVDPSQITIESDPSPDPESETDVSINSTAANTSVSVSNGSAGEPVSIPLAEAVGEDGITLDTINVTPSGDSDFDLTINATATPEDIDAVPNDAVGLLALDIDSSLEDADIEDAVFEFTVPRTVLEDRNLDPNAVTMFHSVDGEWVERETAIVEENGDVTFRTETPHFSRFVLAGNQPSIEILEYSVSHTEISVGEEVLVEVDLENTGGQAGTLALDLIVDDEVVGTETVELDGGERTVVTLSHAFENSGAFDLRVNDQQPVTLTVEADADDAQPGFGFVAPGVALIVILALAMGRITGRSISASK